MILYHITKRKYLTSILTEGLLPSKKPGIAVRLKWDKVFLTNDIKYILECQCGDEWLKHNDCVVLHIDTSELDIEPHKYRCGMTYTLSDTEFVTDRISPEKILKVAEI